ncbi:MAG: PfkB family carbohydrate kinase, partial [Bacteroidota bacterium]
MIDRYLTGKVDRISPEAPVPVVHLQREENRLGGAANVVLNIQALGATPLLASVIGQDAYGENFQRLLLKQQLDEKGIFISQERQTTVKTRVIADNQQLLRADREDTHYLTKAEADALLLQINALLAEQNIDLILFQDYNKGVLSADFINAVLEVAQQYKILTVVDPKKDNFWAYRGVDLFKPNL